ncbi:MAG: hypothetical protein Q9162_005646 [Coniocarpon cinnabarinum]
MVTSKLAGKRILIIGGSSGIGFAVAAHAYSQDATIIISSGNSDRLSKAAARLKQTPTKGAVHTLHCDLSTPEKLEASISALFEQARTVLGISSGPCLDHVVFTAGGAPDFIPIQGVSLATAERASLVRLWAPMLVAKHSTGYLAPSNDSSITLTSGAAAQKAGGPGWITTAGVNAGVEGVARALAVELKPVRVNVVSPGPVATEMYDALPEPEKQGLWTQLGQGLTTGVIAQPRDVAEAYVYLMKDPGCSAAVLSTNGGALVN